MSRTLIALFSFVFIVGSAADAIARGDREDAADRPDKMNRERPDKAEGKFARIDKNGDGKISKAEFLVQPEKHFARIDKNGDGFLTKDEMKEGSKWRKGKRKKKNDRATDGGDRE